MIGLEETTLQLLLEHTPAAVAIFDSNMRYLAASRRYTADYHLTGDSLVGRSHYEVFPEIGDRWKEIHRRCLNGAVERGKDELFLREDGTQDWVSWEIHPWREATGAIGGIVLFSEVISAQKRLEQELAAQERDLEAVINNTDGSIWAVDAQYRLIAGNARYHDDVSPVLGRRLEKGESVLLPAFSAAALAEWQSYYDRALRGEQFSVEVRTRFAQPPRLVEYRVSPIRAADGTITGVTVFGRDVTEQRQLYAVARERKEKLDKLLDLLPVGVSVLDGERNIVFSNRALGEILDLAGDKLAEKAYSTRRYVKADGTPLLPADYATEQALATGRSVHAAETGIVKENGDVIWTSVSALPVDFPDWSAIVTTVDVTARKRSEELIQAQRDLARLIGSGVERQEAWGICLDTARRVSAMDCGSIHLLNGEDGTLELVYAAGLGEAFIQAKARLPYDDPNTQMVLTGRAHYFGADATVLLPSSREEGLRSIAVVPIRYKDETIGSLSLGSHSQCEVVDHARQALETIALEVGNFAVYLRTEDALRASEDKYRSLVEASDAAIVMVDDDGRVHYANTKAATLAGGRTASVVGKRMHEVEPQALADAYLAQARAVMASNQGVVSEIARGGAWYRSSVQPVRNAEGKAIMALFSATDITELKHTQQELVELNRTLEARVAERTAEVQDLYDRAPAGYHSLDPQGRIIRINQTELDWLGYTHEEVVGRPVTDFFTPASKAAFPADYAAFQQLDWLRDQERELVRKDGSIMPVVVNATAMRDEAGRYVMSRSTVFDNTRRKQAEETLRFANHELERAMRLKDEFLANMSHELRTPLNGILTLTEVILEGVYGNLPPRQERAMRHIDASGRHLLELINDLLDLSKVEAGKLTLEMEATAPDEVCQDSMLFVKDLADKKDILLSYNNDDPSARVLADPRRLKQMVVNLLSNAVKFTPGGGRVHVQVQALDGGQVIEFAVQDTGPGIAPEDQARLFQPFMQIDASLAREHDGTGLGLALVRRLAEQHGGTVRVESRGIPGHGSRFIITLPRAPLAQT